MLKLFYEIYYFVASKIIYSYNYRIRNGRSRLKELLIRENKNRWLDLGASISYNDNFYFSDILDPSLLTKEMQKKYFFWDATKPLENEKKVEMGKFDFIRMQHVFEHFAPEEGQLVLKNAFELLNEGGYLLITVPDLKKFIKRYNRKTLHYNWSFSDWAKTRIESTAPQSFYFSIFAHSVPHQAHLWCYDHEGLIYQINKSIAPKKIKFISPFHKLANIPFTHNRPLEDLCVLIQK
jgi:SAM-dependent methyltransferase